MSAFTLKIIAVITMFIDHIGYYIFDGQPSFFNNIGRISFTIFAFQISEGYIHTKNLKKYFLRLVIFALISQYPFMLFASLISLDYVLNVFFILFLGLLCIYIYDKSNSKIFGIFICFIIGIISIYTNCDYGLYGIAIIIIFYIFKNHHILAFLSFTITNVIHYLIIPISIIGYNSHYLWSFIFACASYIFIALYNGKKGKDIKYLLYFFYPIHLLLIYGVYKLLQ